MQAGEKLALKDTTKGDVIVKLVPLIDNFEAAKNSIKVQSDAEQKIVDSYQVSDLEHELGSMWTSACGQHVDWCMWATCGLVHVPLLSCTIKVLWHLSVLLHAVLYMLCSRMWCASCRTSKKHSHKAKCHVYCFAARLKAGHNSCVKVMHVYVPHPATCRKGQRQFTPLVIKTKPPEAAA